MDINTAKTTFKDIVNSLNSDDRSLFLKWCEDNFTETNSSKSYFNLRVIAEDIKTMVPVEAILPSENVDHSSIQCNSDRNLKPIFHVDSFLFEEDHIDDLEADGKVKRNYCEKCGSVDIAPTTFISHSMSINRIQHIFKTMLPDMTGKVILDVGSRLGAILYGAYYCSSAKKIIGVEMNEDFCKLQNHIVEKYGLNDRIEIICSDICNVPELIKLANCILLHNVFQCFMPLEMQQKIWQFLRATITTSGTIVVTCPSIEETLSNLQTGIDTSSWLRNITMENSSMQDEDWPDDPDLLSKIFCYVVL